MYKSIVITRDVSLYYVTRHANLPPVLARRVFPFRRTSAFEQPRMNSAPEPDVNVTTAPIADVAVRYLNLSAPMRTQHFQMSLIMIGQSAKAYQSVLVCASHIVFHR